jgi:hypothetical protein
MAKKIIAAVLAIFVIAIGWFFFRFTVLLPRDIPVPEITLPTSAAEHAQLGVFFRAHHAGHTGQGR